jgi:RNA polymerase sigma-70 factor (ECF subfamily)
VTGPEAREAEVELVRRAAAGDHQAFGALVRRYHKPLVNFAYRYLGQREDAEDVAQDALVRAYASLAELRTPAAFASYLFRIALNLAHRRLGRRRLSTEPLGESEPPAPARPAPGDAAEAVAVAVAALPESLRLPLCLHVQGGLTFSEVGELLGLSEGACRMRYHRARRLVQARLGAHDDPEVG